MRAKRRWGGKRAQAGSVTGGAGAAWGAGVPGWWLSARGAWLILVGAAVAFCARIIKDEAVVVVGIAVSRSWCASRGNWGGIGCCASEWGRGFAVS